MSVRKNIDYKISYKSYKEGFFKRSKMLFVIEEYRWYYYKLDYDYDFEPYSIYSVKYQSDYELSLTTKVVAYFLTKELAEEELKNFKLNSYVEDTYFKM